MTVRRGVRSQASLYHTCGKEPEHRFVAFGGKDGCGLKKYSSSSMSRLSLVSDKGLRDVEWTRRRDP